MQQFPFQRVRARAEDTFVLYPYRITVGHEMYVTQSETEQNVVNWYQRGMHGGGAHFKLVLFNCETWFQVSGYANSQNNRFTILIHDMPIYDAIKVDVWCAMIATRIIGPFFLRS
jgi:hypothetical protein